MSKTIVELRANQAGTGHYVLVKSEGFDKYPFVVNAQGAGRLVKLIDAVGVRSFTAAVAAFAAGKPHGLKPTFLETETFEGNPVLIVPAGPGDKGALRFGLAKARKLVDVLTADPAGTVKALRAAAVEPDTTRKPFKGKGKGGASKPAARKPAAVSAPGPDAELPEGFEDDSLAMTYEPLADDVPAPAPAAATPAPADGRLATLEDRLTFLLGQIIEIKAEIDAIKAGAPAPAVAPTPKPAPAASKPAPAPVEKPNATGPAFTVTHTETIKGKLYGLCSDGLTRVEVRPKGGRKPHWRLSKTVAIKPVNTSTTPQVHKRTTAVAPRVRTATPARTKTVPIVPAMLGNFTSYIGGGF